MLVIYFVFLLTIQSLAIENIEADSLRFIHFRGNFNNSAIKFMHTGKGSVAFLRGSITHMNGWRNLVMEYIQKKFPNTEFEFINAGIFSTGSVPGAFSLQRDVFNAIKVAPNMASKNFRFIRSWIPKDKAKTMDGFVGVPVLEATNPGAQLKYKFRGTMADIFIIRGPEVVIIEYQVDGGSRQQLDLFTQWRNRLHLPKLHVLADGLSEGPHQLKIKIASEKYSASLGHDCRIAFLTLNTK